MVDVESTMNHFDAVMEAPLRYSANTSYCQYSAVVNIVREYVFYFF